MKFPRKQRVVLISLLYVCAAALMICGVWSTAFSRRLAESRHAVEEAPYLVSGDDDNAILSSSEIWTAGARSLTSTNEDSDSSQQEEPASSQEEVASSSEEDNYLQGSLPQLYHVPQIFALNYEEMTKNLRVFIYPNSPTNASYEYDISGKNAQRDEKDSEDATTAGFFDFVARSAFRTRNPDEAHLFLLPVSIAALQTSLGAGAVGNHLRHYIDSIRTAFPFWDRSLGADHFYLASRAFEPVNHRNFLELSKNALQVACSPLAPGQSFYPHKDIVIPHYQTLAPSLASSPRPNLAYVNQDLAQSPLLPQEWKSDADFLLATGSFSSSKFCISLSMRNVVDALRSGCVPVIVSDSRVVDLPFQDVLNWREFSIVIGTEELPAMKQFLAAMADTKVAKMQYLGFQASKHMEWSDETAAFDAFHVTLFELWMRRHSVKYSRRSAEWEVLTLERRKSYVFYGGLIVVFALLLVPHKRALHSRLQHLIPRSRWQATTGAV